MSEELFNSASCSGDCTSCGSDCQDLDQPTVTLTLDDDTEVKCAVLTIFPAPNQKEYIALLPLDENGENEDGEVYDILENANWAVSGGVVDTVNTSTTSIPMKSTKLQQTHSTS